MAKQRVFAKPRNGKELSVFKDQKEGQNDKITVNNGAMMGNAIRESISLDHVGMVDPGQGFVFCSN